MASAHLILDNPEWPMPGLGPLSTPSPRRLRVWRLDDNTQVAIITERGSGASVTNVAASAHAKVQNQYPDCITRVIEHYPPEPGSLEHFDEILVDNQGTLSWRRIPTADMITLCGPAVLDDMPGLPPDPESPPTRHTTPPPPTGPGVPDDHVFHGFTSSSGGRVVTIQAPDGDTYGLLTHYPRHSPDGFSWGYAGSGPAELARCLLIAVLGEHARCPDCAGTGQTAYDVNLDRDVPYDPATHIPDTATPCWACDDGLAVKHHQGFKNQVVAAWAQDKDWAITAGEIRAWLTTHTTSTGVEQ